jgi:hypothetical protein
MAPIVFVLIIPAFFFLGFFRRFTGLERRHAVMVWFGSLVIAGATTGYRIEQMESVLRMARGRQEIDYTIMLASGFLLVPAAAMLAGKLYHRWIGGQFTAEEKLPGADGVRAWLRGGNLIVAGLIPLFAWLGYGWSFPVILLVTLGSLLAYPLLNFSRGSPAAAPEAPKPPDTSAECERILKMVEEGKITAADSATLLASLGTAQHANAQGAAMTPARKLVCAGAALVLIGFFLPWFSFNAADEVKRGVNQAAGQLGQMLPDINASLPGGGLSFDFNTPSIHRNGGEMPHSLGWIVLVLAVGAAALPFLAATMARQTQRTLAFGALGAGAFAVIYLLMQDVRHAGIGMILAIAGYALEFAGTMRDRHA